MKCKRFLCLLLTVLICLAALPLGASAATQDLAAVARIINGTKLYPQRTGFIKLDEQVDALLAKLRPKCKTTADLVLAVYDWMVNDLTYSLGTYYPYYDYDSRSEIPIPFYVLYFSWCPFAEKIGVCDNFSSAFMVILRAIGIDAYIRAGKMVTPSQTYGHAWVEARIDGKYYIFDPQADNSVRSSRGSNMHYYYCAPSTGGASVKVGSTTYVKNTAVCNAYEKATLPVSEKKNAYCYVGLFKGGNGIVSSNAVPAKNVQLAARVAYFSNDDYAYRFNGWIADTGICRIGASVTVTAKPDKGESLVGWYVNDKLVSKELTYTQKITGDTRIEAVFTGERFKDVPEKCWYHDAVYYCFDNSVMTGTGAITFSPDARLTRAMVVTVLRKMSGDNAGSYPEAKSFKDVPSNAYYAAAVQWASANGIAAGDGVNFMPNTDVTREQLAVFMYKYALLKKLDTSARGDLSGFKDAADISAWAREALAWANAASLLSGYSNGNIGARDCATRAQAAVIFANFARSVK